MDTSLSLHGSYTMLVVHCCLLNCLLLWTTQLPKYCPCGNLRNRQVPAVETRKQRFRKMSRQLSVCSEMVEMFTETQCHLILSPTFFCLKAQTEVLFCWQNPVEVSWEGLSLDSGRSSPALVMRRSVVRQAGTFRVPENGMDTWLYEL